MGNEGTLATDPEGLKDPRKKRTIAFDRSTRYYDIGKFDKNLRRGTDAVREASSGTPVGAYMRACEQETGHDALTGDRLTQDEVDDRLRRHHRDTAIGVGLAGIGTFFSKFGRWFGKADDIADEALESRRGVGVVAPNNAGKYLADNWHQGTFPNRMQSVRHHLAKHGKGRTAEQYTRDAMCFFQENKHLGQMITLKDGTPGIKIQTKITIPGRKIHRIGGYWTQDGKLVTFWD